LAIHSPFTNCQMKSVLYLSICLSAFLSALNGQTLYTINTDGGDFNPPTLTIQPGDSVRWTNSGMGFHNVRADDDSFRCANGCDGMGGNGDPASNVWSFTLVFNDPGDVDFYCEIHGGPDGVGMSGVLTVEPGCIPNLMLVNMTIPSGTYLSQGDLTSSMSDIPNGNVVIFKSDTGIVLSQDFTVALGGDLHAVIEACPGSLVLLNAGEK